MQYHGLDGEIPIYINKDILACTQQRRTVKNTDSPINNTAYRINDDVFFEEGCTEDSVIKFEIYAKNDKVKKMDSDCDLYCSTPSELEDSEEEDNNNNPELNIVLEAAPNGYIVNNSCFLTWQQWNTIISTKSNEMFRCALCDVYIEMEESYGHICEPDHEQIILAYPPLEKFDLSIIRKIDNHYHCAVCNEVFELYQQYQHTASKAHEGNLLYAINKASDIIDNYGRETKHPKPDSYHFETHKMNDSNSDIDSYEADTNFFNYQNDYEDFEPEESSAYDGCESLTFTGTSYASVTRKTKAESFLNMDLGDITVKVVPDSWNMIICPDNTRFWCMICKVYDRMENKPDHCNSEKHLNNLQQCPVVDTFRGYFIRQVNDMTYHCGHCNNLQLISSMGEHIKTKHSKRNRLLSDSDISSVGTFDMAAVIINDWSVASSAMNSAAASRRATPVKDLTSPVTNVYNPVNDRPVTTLNYDNAAVATSFYDKAAVTTSIYDKAAATTSIYDKAAVTTSIYDKAAVTTSIYDKAADTTSIYDKAAITTSSYNKAAVTTSIYDKAAITTSSYNKAAVTTSIYDKAAVTNSIYDKAPATTSIYDKAAVTTSIYDKAAITTSSYNKAAVTTSIYDKAAVTNSIYDKAPATTSIYDKAAVTTSIYDKAAVTTSIYDKAAVTTSIYDKAAVTNSIYDKAPATTSIYDKAAVTTSIYDKAAVTTSIYDKAAVTTSIYDKAAGTRSIYDKAAATTSIYDKAAVTTSIYDKAAVTTSSYNKAAFTTSTYDKAAITTLNYDEAAVTTSIYDKAAVTTSSYNKAAVTTSIYDKAAITTLNYDEAAVTASIYDKAAVATSIYDKAAVTTSIYDKAAVTTLNYDEAAVTNLTSPLRKMTVNDDELFRIASPENYEKYDTLTARVDQAQSVNNFKKPTITLNDNIILTAKSCTTTPKHSPITNFDGMTTLKNTVTNTTFHSPVSTKHSPVTSQNPNVSNNLYEMIKISAFGYKLVIQNLFYNVICKRYADFYCGLCDVGCNEDEVLNHIAEARHIVKLERTPFIQHFSCHLIRAIRDAIHCTICNIPFTFLEIFDHIKDIRHSQALSAALSLYEKIDLPVTVQILYTDTAESYVSEFIKRTAAALASLAHTPESIGGKPKQNKHVVENIHKVETKDNTEVNVDENEIYIKSLVEDLSDNADNEDIKVKQDYEQYNLGDDHIDVADKTIDEAEIAQKYTLDDDDIDPNENACNFTKYTFSNSDSSDSEPFEIADDKVKKFKTPKTRTEMNLLLDSGETSEEAKFDFEEHVYLKLKNSYIRINNASYNTLVAVGDGSRYCFVCSIKLPFKDLQKHVDSRSHLDTLQQYHFLDKYERHWLRQIYLTYHCSICNVLLTRKELKSHLEWPTHISQNEEFTKDVKNLLKRDTKNGKFKKITVTTQKEIIYLNADEPKPKINLNAKIGKEMAGKKEPNLKKKEPENSRKNKIIILNEHALIFSWECWNGVCEIKNGFRCNLCQREIRTEDIEAHCGTEWHRYGLDKPFETKYAPALIRKVNESVLNCLICNRELANKDHLVLEHLNGRKHIKNYEDIVKQSALDVALDDCQDNVLRL